MDWRPLQFRSDRHLKTWHETPEKWLCSNRRGKPYSANNIVQRKLWPTLDTLRVPRCELHAFLRCRRLS